MAGILAEAFPSRQEFGEILAEIRALREDFRRFADETARRFQAMDLRFDPLLRARCTGSLAPSGIDFIVRSRLP